MEIDIIKLIENNHSITANEITEKLELTIDSVKHYINKLKKQNVIKHEG
ncbi:MAG: winged helix-turn-helix domain-containing protein [Lachnospiraceae bacterium]|nr:winged helix-turn-helix domain-containing protein [Lachnospiraceae bacterium]